MKPQFKKYDIVLCDCGACSGPQQVLRIDTNIGVPQYKIAYYNAIIGGRHWVFETHLRPY